MTCTHPNCTGEARWSFDGRSVCRTHAVELAARGRPGRLLNRPPDDFAWLLDQTIEHGYEKTIGTIGREGGAYLVNTWIIRGAAEEIRRLRAELAIARRQAGASAHA